jgi:hypothetical protein
MKGLPQLSVVIPAEAGIHGCVRCAATTDLAHFLSMDSRFRGNDGNS